MAVHIRPKELVRRYTEEVWSKGDVDAMPEILTQHQIYHDPAGSGEEHLSEFATFIQRYRDAFPDLRFDVSHMVEEGDHVAFWGRVTGTHEGPFMGLEPTGRQIDIMGISAVRLEDGKIAERWANFDILGMLQQLGVEPLGTL
ncbi:ester cyclase [Haladaptatus sp. DJG-WS-42]|uniref:ester cyclase n=1 Tax=Haladaptatus sp. DJG-WS-42 TaxID=3120516 RepID=UPI0030CA98E4